MELKANWRTEHGRKLSGIANLLSGGWLVVGVDDRGSLVGHDKNWAMKKSAELGDQINRLLSPSDAVKNIFTEHHEEQYYLLVDIQNPGLVTEWGGEPFKLAGTSCCKMTAGERLSLSMKLPGYDFSAQPWQGKIDEVLVVEFAKKVMARDNGFDGGREQPTDVLRVLGIAETMTTKILFGDSEVRIAHYDENDDVISNVTKKGLYNILTDNFIEHIQTWTQREGTVIEADSMSVTG